METAAIPTTVDDLTPLRNYSPGHNGALRRFAMSITVLTLLGHLFLGFEQSFVQPLVALGVGYAMQILMECLYAWTNNIKPRFLGGGSKFVDFLLPAHIASLSIVMLMYSNNRLWIITFAVAAAIGSKSVFRAPVGSGSRHFLNPSNFALSLTFFLFPSVGLTMPWQWTTELSGFGDWIFPVIVFALGTMLHLKYASRIWVVVSFLVAFLIQAVIRSLTTDTSIITALLPATGVAAMIFVFYMAPDPATTPSSRTGQIIFGASIPAVYMVLMLFHVVFALFYALTLVCMARGIGMWLVALKERLTVLPDQPALT